MKIDNPKITGKLTLIDEGTSELSGSFSGSFQGSFIGDGSQLSGVTSYTDSDTLSYINSLGVISGSEQLATEISGAFNQTDELLSNRISTLEQFSSSLDTTFATDTELQNLSSSLATSISNINPEPFPYTGSAKISGSLEVTDSIIFDKPNASFKLPTGTTEDRPSTPSPGFLRFNVDSKLMELFDGEFWRPLLFVPPQIRNIESIDSNVISIDALGKKRTKVQSINSVGTSLNLTSKRIVMSQPIFSTATSFDALNRKLVKLQSITSTATAVSATGSVIPKEFDVEYLVIAGGGGGGEGGGGGGGYRSSVIGGSSGGGASAESTLTVEIDLEYSIAVGAGGPSGGSGSTSTFSTISSTGGGFGGKGGGVKAGAPGGSGGGGGASNSVSPGGSGTSGQGYAGGTNKAGNPWHSGGGGGAGGTGQVGQPGGGGAGGGGVASNITGSNIGRAGGGGGSAFSTGFGGAPGGSGAGQGAGTDPSRTFTAGAANTGGGGGGTNVGGGTGGAGGSGIVIIRYPNQYSVNAGAGLSSNTITVGSSKVTQFTSGTDTITFSVD